MLIEECCLYKKVEIVLIMIEEDDDLECDGYLVWVLVEEWDDEELIVEYDYINGMVVFVEVEKIKFVLKRKSVLRLLKDLDRLFWRFGLKLKFNVMVVFERVVIIVVES